MVIRRCDHAGVITMTAKRGLTSLVGFGLVLGLAAPSSAQNPVLLGPGPGLERLARRMADAVRDLADDIATIPNLNAPYAYLEPDTRELQAAAGAWYATVQATSDPYQLRQSYANIDVAWHRLRGQIGTAGLVDPATLQEVRRVEEVDAQVHQALGLNDYPTTNPGGIGVPPPIVGTGPIGLTSDPNDARRLAYTVAQRAEALVNSIRVEAGVNPALNGQYAGVNQLAQAVDGYYDAFNNPAVIGQPNFAQVNYAPIVRQANTLGIALEAAGMTPGLRSAWNSFTASHNLLRSNLNLAYPTADGFPPAGGQVPTLGYGVPAVPSSTAAVGWAAELDRQVNDLLVHFVPTVRVVPEGRFMLADMERIKQAVTVFRQEAARGASLGQLSAVFGEVDVHWQRLARRVDRIGRGRTGPNIQRIAEIGQTCQQIHQALGMPGYAPTFGPL